MRDKNNEDEHKVSNSFLFKERKVRVIVGLAPEIQAMLYQGVRHGESSRGGKWEA